MNSTNEMGSVQTAKNDTEPTATATKKEAAQAPLYHGLTPRTFPMALECVRLVLEHGRPDASEMITRIAKRFGEGDQARSDWFSVIKPVYRMIDSYGVNKTRQMLREAAAAANQPEPLEERSVISGKRSNSAYHGITARTLRMALLCVKQIRERGKHQAWGHIVTGIGPDATEEERLAWQSTFESVCSMAREYGLERTRQMLLDWALGRSSDAVLAVGSHSMTGGYTAIVGSEHDLAARFELPELVSPGEKLSTNGCLRVTEQDLTPGLAAVYVRTVAGEALHWNRSVSVADRLVMLKPSAEVTA